MNGKGKNVSDKKKNVMYYRSEEINRKYKQIGEIYLRHFITLVAVTIVLVSAICFYIKWTFKTVQDMDETAFKNDTSRNKTLVSTCAIQESLLFPPRCCCSSCSLERSSRCWLEMKRTFPYILAMSHNDCDKSAPLAARTHTSLLHSCRCCVS